MIHIYVDGSFNSQNLYSGWGFVVIDSNDDDILYEACGKTPCIALSRQIDGELYASIKALEWTAQNNYKMIQIFHDFIGIERWYTNRWKAKKRVARAYIRYIGSFKREHNDITVKFKHVPSHTGNKWNDYADKLAAKGKYL